MNNIYLALRTGTLTTNGLRMKVLILFVYIWFVSKCKFSIMKKKITKSLGTPVKKKPKITDGPVRNVVKTKEKIFAAFGEVLSERDLRGLNITNIFKKANRDKKLVYEYFGGLPQLKNAYEKRNNFTDVEINETEISERLIQEFDELCTHDELLGNVFWTLSERRKKTAENLNNRFLKVIDDGNDDDQIRKSLIMGGLVYLAMYSKIEGRTICGIDVSTEKGKNQIKESVRDIFRTD